MKKLFLLLVTLNSFSLYGMIQEKPMQIIPTLFCLSLQKLPSYNENSLPIDLQKKIERYKKIPESISTSIEDTICLLDMVALKKVNPQKALFMICEAKKCKYVDVYLLKDDQQAQVVAIRELLEHGADIYQVNNDGKTALDVALIHGRFDVVKELLDQSATVDNKRSCYIASWRRLRLFDVVKLLLDEKADLNRVNNGQTALFIAAGEGWLSIVKELLNKGAQIDPINVDGETPLYLASENGHLEIVKTLLACGSNVDEITNFGETSLYSAAKKGRYEIIKELLAHGADVHLANNNGWTPLYTASKYGHVAVVEELLRAGAIVNKTNKYGWTPLHAAAEYGNFDVVKELLKCGANVYKANNIGMTPLDIALCEGHEAIIEMLKKHMNKK